MVAHERRQGRRLRNDLHAAAAQRGRKHRRDQAPTPHSQSNLRQLALATATASGKYRVVSRSRDHDTKSECLYKSVSDQEPPTPAWGLTAAQKDGARSAGQAGAAPEGAGRPLREPVLHARAAEEQPAGDGAGLGDLADGDLQRELTRTLAKTTGDQARARSAPVQTDDLVLGGHEMTAVLVGRQPYFERLARRRDGRIPVTAELEASLRRDEVTLDGGAAARLHHHRPGALIGDDVDCLHLLARVKGEQRESKLAQSWKEKYSWSDSQLTVRVRVRRLIALSGSTGIAPHGPHLSLNRRSSPSNRRSAMRLASVIVTGVWCAMT